MHDVFVVGDILTDRILQITDPQIVASIDEANHTLSLPFPSKIQLEAPPQILGGGNAYNMAIAMSKLGLNIGLYSVVGKDDAGKQLVEELNNQNVDTSLVTTDTDSPTNSSYVLSVRGDRVLFSHHYNRLYELPEMPSVRYVMLTSIGEDDKKLFDQLVEHKQQANYTLVFAPGTRQIREPFADIKATLEHTDILVLNKREAKEMTHLNTESVENLLEALYNLGPRVVVITRSTHGSIAYDGQQFVKAGALPVEVVESTGAGDTYAATLTAGFALDLDLKTAMEWAAINAASVVQQVGRTEGLLDRQSLQAQHQQFQDKLVYDEPIVDAEVGKPQVTTGN